MIREAQSRQLLQMTEDYDRTIKKYDEPYAPEHLVRLVESGQLNRGKFLRDAHFFSYREQMRTLLELDVQRVLEVGPGEGVVGDYLRRLGLEIDTLDIVDDPEPTYRSRLEDFDPSEVSHLYDAVCAFQVLEHSPYEEFRANVGKMRNMSARYVFLSLPYDCNEIRFTIRIGLGKRAREKTFSFHWNRRRENRRYRPEYVEEFPWAVHYWEVGREGFPLKRIVGDVESAGLQILRQWHSPNHYHYFILAERS